MRTEKLIVQIEELAVKITLTVLDLQSNKQRTWTLREKSENSRKVISKEIVCFKIIKLVYNKTIYIKTF